MGKKAIEILRELSDKIYEWRSDCDCWSSKDMYQMINKIDDFLEEIDNPKKPDIICANCDSVLTENDKECCEVCPACGLDMDEYEELPYMPNRICTGCGKSFGMLPGHPICKSCEDIVEHSNGIIEKEFISFCMGSLIYGGK